MMSGLTELFRYSTPVELVSPHSPAQCASLLAAAIDSEWSAAFTLFPKSDAKPVIGKASESKMRLRKRIGYKNSFQSILRASMQRAAQGTAISGTVGMHPSVVLFAVIWLSGVVVAGGSLLISTVGAIVSASGNLPPNAWNGIVIPLSMAAFGVGLLAIGRYSARDEARFLTDFLASTLDAREPFPTSRAGSGAMRPRAPGFS